MASRASKLRRRLAGTIAATLAAGLAFVGCTRPAPGQVAIDLVDVVQSVQNPLEPVPLITGKTTYVLVYLAAGGTDVSGVGGVLTVPGLAPLAPTGSRTVTARTHWSMSSLDSALVFRLTPAMTAAGNRQVDINLTLPSGHTAPTDSNGHSRAHYSATLTFGPQAAPTLTMYAFRYGYSQVPADIQATDGLTSDAYPPQPRSVVDTMRGVAENVLPIAHLNLDWSLEDRYGVQTYPCTEVGGGCSTYVDARNWVSTKIDEEFPDGGQWAVVIQPERTRGAEHGLSCMTPAGNHRLNLWVEPTPYLGLVLAHELGHSLGLGHTPEVGAVIDPNYPRPDGSMGGWYGLRYASGPPRVQAGQTDAGAVALHDIMSYTEPRWISPYSYCAALHAATRDQLTCPPSLDGNGRFALGTGVSGAACT